MLTPELLQPVERIDALVSGSELGLGLAEELELLEPTGIGNPSPRLLVPGARFAEMRTMGEGRHARFAVSAGRRPHPGRRVRLRRTAPASRRRARRRDASGWSATSGTAPSSRGCCCATRGPARPSEIAVPGEPDTYLRAVIDELDRPLEAGRRGASRRQARVDLSTAAARARSPCSPTPARRERRCSLCARMSAGVSPGFAPRAGGFALISHHALEDAPGLAERFEQIVVLDPPACEGQAAAVAAGAGFAHLAWGEAELRFAKQIHELEYGLRPSLVALYRELRSRGRVTGEELEHLLRGHGPHLRPARLAGRLIRVLAELELVSLERDLPALAVAGAARTALERSPAFRVYAKRHEDGRRFLNNANPTYQARVGLRRVISGPRGRRWTASQRTKSTGPRPDGDARSSGPS